MWQMLATGDRFLSAILLGPNTYLLFGEARVIAQNSPCPPDGQFTGRGFPPVRARSTQEHCDDETSSVADIRNARADWARPECPSRRARQQPARGKYCGAFRRADALHPALSELPRSGRA